MVLAETPVDFLPPVQAVYDSPFSRFLPVAVTTPSTPKKTPAKRPRTRKAAAPASDAQQSLFPDAPAEAKPKKPRTRKTTAKTAAKTVQSVAGTSSVPAESTAANAPPLKPRKSALRRKKAAPAAPKAAAPAPSAPSGFRRFVLILLLLVLLGGAVLGGALWWLPHQPMALAQETEFTVSRGMTLRQATQQMARAGLPVHPELLYWAARLNHQGERIVAGSYVAEPGITPLALIEKIERGDVARATLRLGEGWTFRQIRAALADAPYMVNDIEGMDDATLLARIGATESNPEGLFFPDTYHYDRHSGALAFLREAYRSMQAHLADAWAKRDPGLPLRSPYEALILASIIEKETGQPDERGRVAAVFTNRLRLGMKLQTDPTVLYGFGADAPPRLLRRHLETDHPYNTYTRYGLPPTPIASPGEAALMAAVRPEKSDYLYFVARNDGSSEFSRTLDEHNRAVNRYQRGGNPGKPSP